MEGVRLTEKRPVPSIISLRRLYELLRPAIDLLKDPVEREENYSETLRAYGKVLLLLSNPDIWELIKFVEPDNKSNFLLHNLGPERVSWLQDFYEREVPEKVKA